MEVLFYLAFPFLIGLVTGFVLGWFRGGWLAALLVIIFWVWMYVTSDGEFTGDGQVALEWWVLVGATSLAGVGIGAGAAGSQRPDRPSLD